MEIQHSDILRQTLRVIAGESTDAGLTLSAPESQNSEREIPYLWLSVVSLDKAAVVSYSIAIHATVTAGDPSCDLGTSCGPPQIELGSKADWSANY